MASQPSAQAAHPRAASLATLDAQMDAAVAAIEQADRKALLDRWAEHFGRSAPSHMREDLLRRALAHEVQLCLVGARARAVCRRVERLVESGPGKREAVSSARVSAGVCLVREWNGEVHQVTALGKGFAYRDSTYKSLSEIARLITGTRWSGPLFFGLRATRGGG
jgi:hypothetical protein